MLAVVGGFSLGRLVVGVIFLFVGLVFLAFFVRECCRDNEIPAGFPAFRQSPPAIFSQPGWQV